MKKEDGEIIPLNHVKKEDRLIMAALLVRLTDAKWVSSTLLSNNSLSVKWTKKGKTVMRSLWLHVWPELKKLKDQQKNPDPNEVLRPVLEHHPDMQNLSQDQKERLIWLVFEYFS